MAEVKDIGLCMGYLPGRKRPAVWIEREATITPLAYFVSEEAYARFKETIGGSGLVQAPPGWPYDDEDA